MRLLVLLVQLVAAAGLLAATGSAHMALQAAGISTTAASIGSNTGPDENVKVRMLLLLYLTHFGEQAVTAAKPVP